MITYHYDNMNSFVAIISLNFKRLRVLFKDHLLISFAVKLHSIYFLGINPQFPIVMKFL